MSEEIIHPHLLPTYAEVQSAFANFTVKETAPGESHSRFIRGGYPTGKKTFHAPGTVRSVGINGGGPYEHYAKTYRQESSFTPEQRRYVKLTAACLNALLEGNVLPEARLSNEESLPTFSDRVVQHFQSQTAVSTEEGIEEIYLSALAAALIDTLDDLYIYYPMLMPALHAMFSMGGLQGLDLELFDELDYFDNRLQGNQMFAQEWVARATKKERFRGVNPGGYHEENQFEIQCPGENDAKTMLEIVPVRVDRAIQLLPEIWHHSELPASYYHFDFVQAPVKNKVNQLFEKARLRFEDSVS